MRAWALALVLCDCGFSSPAPSHGPDGGGPGPGSDPTSEVDHVCLGTFVQVCADAPRVSLSLMTQTIDTSNSALCLPYTATPSVDACVIASQSIAIPSGNTVSVTGLKRLILFADESLTVAGLADTEALARRKSREALRQTVA